MTTVEKKKERGLKNTIYSDLKEKLINCVYEPGTVLNEIQLTNEYGVSRTPVREAISRLEMDGYISILPKKGIYVTDISLGDVMQIFQTRIEIEPLCLRMASDSGLLDERELIMFMDRFRENNIDISDSFRLDTAMHLYLIEHCGNQYIINMMRKLFDDNTRVVIASKQNLTKIHNATCEHLEILESLLRHDDVTKTAELMKNHIESCRRSALDYFCSTKYINLLDTESFSYKHQLSKLP